MPSRNIELKARCADLDRAEQLALNAGAQRAGLIVQTDTYFQVSHGRLKLRKIHPDKAELIYYDRSDRADPRPSDYSIVPVASPGQLCTLLSAALGVKSRVTKRRRLLLWQNVRIHLDEVSELGTFLELEALVSTADPEPVSLDRLNALAGILGIASGDRICGSYGDLKMSG